MISNKRIITDYFTKSSHQMRFFKNHVIFLIVPINIDTLNVHFFTRHTNKFFKTVKFDRKNYYYRDFD